VSEKEFSIFMDKDSATSAEIEELRETLSCLVDAFEALKKQHGIDPNDSVLIHKARKLMEKA
jgi:hypothetical protein